MQPSNKYDVFISFKNSDENGQPTQDRSIAEQLCKTLENNGLRVFISTNEMERLGKGRYSDVIDEALENAQTLVAVGCSAQHLKSNWVRYEWNSFLNEIRSDRKPGGEVFVLYKDMKIRDLPVSLRQQQAFDAADKSSFESVCTYVKNAKERAAKEREDAPADPPPKPIKAAVTPVGSPPSKPAQKTVTPVSPPPKPFGAITLLLVALFAIGTAMYGYECIFSYLPGSVLSIPDICWHCAVNALIFAAVVTLSIFTIIYVFRRNRLAFRTAYAVQALVLAYGIYDISDTVLYYSSSGRHIHEYQQYLWLPIAGIILYAATFLLLKRSSHIRERLLRQ